MNGNKEKDDDILYLDIEEFLQGKGINVDINNDKEKKNEK